MAHFVNSRHQRVGNAGTHTGVIREVFTVVLDFFHTAVEDNRFAAAIIMRMISEKRHLSQYLAMQAFLSYGDIVAEWMPALRTCSYESRILPAAFINGFCLGWRTGFT